MIQIEHLKVNYGKQVALDIDQSINFTHGQRIGIIGSNGAGKSTLIKAILNLIPYQGKINRSLPVQDMAVHLQANEYVKTMSCRHIMEAILNTSIKNNPDLHDLIDYFEMSEHLGKKYKNLSGGQKQRFTLIMVLFQKAEMTFFDEVTSGLDFETRQKLVKKIQDWYQDSQASYCVVSHYYEELEQLVDTILLLEKGHVVAYGKKQDLFNRYCGQQVILIENTPANQAFIANYQILLAPESLIAIRVDNADQELALVKTLIDHNIDYQRTSHDIELMTINAKDAYYKKGVE